MISILIPIYNWDASTLINSLVKQGNSINVAYEIIAIDDCSNSAHDVTNFSMNQYDFVQVYRNEKNLGRSKTRNLLAAKANYDWLLFIDSDSWIEDDFLVNYLKAIKSSDADVICGGRVYSEIAPSDNNYSLHWKFGKKRDSKNVQQRNDLIYKGFASNNFAIKSLVFTSIQFEENSGFGNEDTLFAKSLEKKQFKLDHIDNPVKHLGLRTNEDLILNSEKKIDNLVKLYKEKKLNIEDVNLLALYFKRAAVSKTFSLFSKKFARNRAVKSGYLFFFDLYRLNYLTEKLVS